MPKHNNPYRGGSYRAHGSSVRAARAYHTAQQDEERRAAVARSFAAAQRQPVKQPVKVPFWARVWAWFKRDISVLVGVAVALLFVILVVLFVGP